MSNLNWAALMLWLFMLGGVMVAVILVLFRGAQGGDLDWQIARMDRKLDLILTHLGLGHDDHVPEIVRGLALAGRKIEAIKEYRKLTGASLVVAKREVEFIMERNSAEKAPAQDEL